MKDIFKARAIERPGLQPRRWCPLCYQHWDPEESWEPLLWSISGVFRCPVHKCVLISECTACGSGQASGVAIDRRRWCQKCGAGLSGDGTFVETPRFYEWIDAQICGLVTLCATAGRDPLSGNVLTQLTSKLIKRKLNKNRRHRRDIDTIRMCLGSTHGEQTVSGLSIKTLVNLSALHGASVVDMVMRPGEIMSKPLFDIWSGFHWLCDPFERKDGHVKAARWLLKRLLAHSGLLYLPTMRILTKDIGVSPSRLEAFDPETYGSYMDAYENQQCPSVRYARGRAFSVACKRLKDINPDRWRRNRLWWLPREVGKEAHVSEDDAFCACSSAIIYSRLLARAVKHTERSVAAKEDIRWIESSPVGADT
ncbi:TniQ family protein [Dyella flava]